MQLRGVMGLLLVLGAGPLSAQRLDPRIPDGMAIGVTMDRFRLIGDEEHYTTFTLHVTGLKAGGLSPDFSLGLFPTVMPAGSIATVLDASVGYNISLPRVTIIPRAGPTAFSVFGLYGSAAAIGYQAGVTLLINIGKTDAIRLDLTRRQFLANDNELGASLSIGIGISGVQSRKPAGVR